MGRMKGVLSRIRELKRKITYAENKRIDGKVKKDGK